MIEYKKLKPSLGEYKLLFESTGWTASISISDETLQAAIDNSWHWISAFDAGRLVGIGRLISDGALYAFVCDMIVLPGYRKRGVGTEILKLLKEKCSTFNIQRVWLFAAAGVSEFYVKNGFAKRPGDAPGMQMIDPSR